ncbi:tetratricopeptide repeat protein [Candidatus Omnitrophota bacterium]
MSSEEKHLDLGNLYLNTNRHDLALKEFNKALEFNPDSEYAYQGLGHLHLQQNRYELALDIFKKALKINPRNEYVRQGLGTIYLGQGLYSLARLEFEHASRFGSGNIFVHQMLGYVYKRLGKHNLAVSEFIKATDFYLDKNKELIGDGGFRVKIFRMPNFCNEQELYSTELNCSLFPPLALGQIVAYLRTNGIKIDQDDLNIKIHYDNYYSSGHIDISVFRDEERMLAYLSGNPDKYIDSLMEEVEKKSKFQGYDVILFSLPIIFSNSSSIMFTLALSRFIKKKYNPMLIVGGGNQSIDLLTKYDYKDIDLIIYGDGEIILFNLLKALIAKDMKGFLDSQTKDDGKLIATKIYPSIKPDFSGLPMDRYMYRGKNSFSHNESLYKIVEEFNSSRTLLLPFKFIKGCPNECVFCPEATNRIIYSLSPRKVAIYLKELQEEHNPTGFFFLSDTMNLSRQYANEICKHIIKNKVRTLWTDSVRPDNLDKATIFKMREAGCIRLVFGMETSSATLLKYVDKKISLMALENILRWSDEAGIWTGVEIISGLPHETERDIDGTVAFLNRNKQYINSIYFNQFGLRDGSLIRQDPGRFGIENIREVCQYADGEFTYFHKYGYDETNGLKWEEKKKQILCSHKKLLHSTWEMPSFPIYEFEHFLFFLYARFDDKQKIYSILNEVAKEKNAMLGRLRDDKFARCDSQNKTL